MPLLSKQDAEVIQKELVDHMAGDVKLTLVGPSALNPPARDLTPQIRELYQEVAALSPRIQFEYLDLPTPEQRTALGLETDESGPLTIVSGAAKGKVRFLGAPAGHEFPALIRDLIDVSRGQAGLSEASRTALAEVKRPVHIKVFFTPT